MLGDFLLLKDRGLLDIECGAGTDNLIDTLIRCKFSERLISRFCLSHQFFCVESFLAEDSINFFPELLFMGRELAFTIGLIFF